MRVPDVYFVVYKSIKKSLVAFWIGFVICGAVCRVWLASLMWRRATGTRDMQKIAADTVGVGHAWSWLQPIMFHPFLFVCLHNSNLWGVRGYGYWYAIRWYSDASGVFGCPDWDCIVYRAWADAGLVDLYFRKRMCLVKLHERMQESWDDVWLTAGADAACLSCETDVWVRNLHPASCIRPWNCIHSCRLDSAYKQPNRLLRHLYTAPVMQAGAAGQPNTPFISPKTWIQGYADIKKI